MGFRTTKNNGKAIQRMKGLIINVIGILAVEAWVAFIFWALLSS